MDSSGAGAAAGGSMFSSILSLAIAVVYIVGMWKLFVKAGEAGWKCLIPFYGTYVLGKIATKKMSLVWAYLGLTCGLVVLGGIMFFTTISSLVLAYGGSQSAASGMFAGTGISLILFWLVAIAQFVIAILLNLRLARSFGESTGFAVGLILLNVIFTCILGFGSAEYIGPCED